ncbi:MAG: methyltransferase [Gemmataceae bacterium]
MPSPHLDLLDRVRGRLKPPVLIALGSPRQASDITAALALPDTACYQIDLYQASRLRDELRELGADAEVHTAADLWDVPGPFGSVLVPSPARGERELKRDIVEQAYHVLEPRGILAVLSPIEREQFYPDLMKKVFGKVALEVADAGTVLWSPRPAKDRPRRRHEVTFHVRDGERSVAFASQPGAFTYGRMDDGARALAEAMTVKPGDAVVDIGCGTGTVGVLAGLRGGTVTFVDSNLRAVALAERNAKAAGLTDTKAVAAVQLEGLPEKAFDLALANPPYYAQQSIASMFIDGAVRLLKPGGRLVLVTKAADIVGEMLYERFGEPTMELRRGYAVFTARKGRRRS